MSEEWEDETFAWEILREHNDLQSPTIEFANRLASAAMWMFYELEEEWPESDYEFQESVHACQQDMPDIATVENPREAIVEMLVRLRDLAGVHGAIYPGCEGESARRYQYMLQERDGIFGATHSAQQTGWDRIHDDMKADGQPIAGDYSDDGVYYVHGVKVQGKRKFK